MSVDSPAWEKAFHSLYQKIFDLYRAGHREPHRCCNPAEDAFLASIGHRPGEIYDFVEDWCLARQPPFETALAIARVRREYFLTVQGGQWSQQRIRMDQLPTKDAELAGYPWLPRIIHKARAKLRGEMPDELMYGCGGDRAFLAKFQIDAADFLRTTWLIGDDTARMVGYLRSGVISE